MLKVKQKKMDMDEKVTAKIIDSFIKKFVESDQRTIEK